MPNVDKLKRVKHICRQLRRSVVERFGAETVSVLDDERVAFKRTWKPKHGSGTAWFTCSVHPRGKIRVQFTKNLIPKENIIGISSARDQTPIAMIDLHCPAKLFKVVSPLDSPTMHGHWDVVDGEDQLHTIANAELMLHALCAL